jgi:hypothetical protein
MLVAVVPAGLSAVASCSFLRVLTVGSFNLVRPVLGRQDLSRLEHLSFGGGFANKGLHLLFPLLDLKSLHITVRPERGTSPRCCLSATCSSYVVGDRSRMLQRGTVVGLFSYMACAMLRRRGPPAQSTRGRVLPTTMC